MRPRRPRPRRGKIRGRVFALGARGADVPPGAPSIALPDAFAPLDRLHAPDVERHLAPFRAYLESRGISMDVIRRHGIGCALAGRYAARVIFPVHLEGHLVAFQARDITGRSAAKYIGPPGVRLGEVLFNLDDARTHDRIVLCEGIVSAIRTGPDAVACFGKALSPSQVGLLTRASKPVVVLFDERSPQRDRVTRTPKHPSQRPSSAPQALPSPSDTSAREIPLRSPPRLCAQCSKQRYRSMVSRPCEWPCASTIDLTPARRTWDSKASRGPSTGLPTGFAAPASEMDGAVTARSDRRSARRSRNARAAFRASARWLLRALAFGPLLLTKASQISNSSGAALHPRQSVVARRCGARSLSRARTNAGAPSA